MDEKKGLFGLFGGKKKADEAKKAEDLKKAETREKFLDPKKKISSGAPARRDVQAKREKLDRAVKKHIVVSGDTLSGIAKKYYDDAGKYMAIYEANKAVIGDNPDLIQPGMELVIPKQ